MCGIFSMASEKDNRAIQEILQLKDRTIINALQENLQRVNSHIRVSSIESLTLCNYLNDSVRSRLYDTTKSIPQDFTIYLNKNSPH